MKTDEVTDLLSALRSLDDANALIDKQIMTVVKASANAETDR